MLNKRGQVTLFIIIAVVIVAVVVLFLVLRGRVAREAPFEPVEPKSYIQKCAKEILESALENITLQGGYLIPPESYLYLGYKVGYLCCPPVAPVRALIELEIKKTEGIIEECTNSAVAQIEAQGKEVTAGNFSFDVNITPGHVNLFIRRPITIKNKATLTYENFDISYSSAMNTFIIITQDIVNGESQGPFDPVAYYNTHLPKAFIETPVNKDEVIVYNLTSTETQETFLFAIKK